MLKLAICGCACAFRGVTSKVIRRAEREKKSVALTALENEDYSKRSKNVIVWRAAVRELIICGALLGI